MQAMTERLELRFDEEKLQEVDAWRARQEDVPSRSEAIRRLVDRGLAAGGTNFHVTQGESLIIQMLADVMKSQKVKSELSPDFIKEALMGGHLWAFDWQYPGAFAKHVDNRQVVSDVVDILEMWRSIEDGYSALNTKDKQRVEKEAEPFGKNPKFPGFDGNNETEHIGIARFLTDDMDQFATFKGRVNNSHMPSVESYHRMLEVFLPIRKNLVGRELNASELIEMLNARTHPGRRRNRTPEK